MICQKIKNKALTRILRLKFFVNVVHKIGRQYLLCFLYLLALDAKGQDREKPAILCLTRLHFQRDVDQLREDNKNLVVKIKCKSKGDRNYIIKELEKCGISYPNFEINFKKVYQNFLVVIGCNSLAMIKAVLSDSYSVMSNWGDNAKDPQNQNISPDSEANFHYDFALSPDYMKGIVLDCVANKNNSVKPFEDRIAFFNRYFYFSKSPTFSEKSSLLVRGI